MLFEFFIAEDFFKDLQEEFKNWEANASASGEKPKSLWEELAVREEILVVIMKILSWEGWMILETLFLVICRKLERSLLNS